MSCFQSDFGVNFVCNKVVESVWARLDSVIHFRENLDAMKSNLEKLKKYLDEVESILFQLEDPNHNARAKVEDWIKSAKNVINQCDPLLIKIENTAKEIIVVGRDDADQTRHDRFSFTTKVKYSWGLKKLGMRTGQLIGEYNTFSNPLAVESLLDDPTFGNEGIVDALMDSLRLKNVSIVGVYGEAGIGKTAIVKKLILQLERDIRGFKVVIYVQVQVSESGSVNWSDIVDDIGRRVLIDHPDKKPWRTERLSDKVRLISAVLLRTKFVLILDNVPFKIDLKRIGVLTPDAPNGSKVIISCRELNVCGHMLVQKKFQVQPLSPKHAWELFCIYAARDVENKSLTNLTICRLAIKICNQCHGVPGKIIRKACDVATASTVSDWEQYLED